MLKRFFYLTLFFLRSSLLFAESDLELTPIVVSKRDFYLLKDYTLKNDRLELTGKDNIFSSLKYTPVELQTRSPDIQSDLSIRGCNFEQIAVLFNGRKINDPQTAHHNSDLPIVSLNMERVDIAPAGGSSLFGPNTIGGAINFITQREFERKNIFQLAGSSNQLKSFLLVMDGLRFNSLWMRLSSELKESQGFYDDTDFKKYTLNIDSMAEFPYGDFDMFFGYQEKEFGAYDFYTPSKGYPSFEWTKTYLLNTELNLKTEGFSLTQGFLWRRHYDKFLLDKTLLRSRYLNYHQTDIFSPIFYLKGEDLLGGIFGLGFEYTQEKIFSTNLGRHTRSSNGFFIEERNDFDKFSYSISWRGDFLENKKDISTGSLNINYLLDGYRKIFVGFSRSIRFPSFTELYYTDPTTEGNPSLLPEEAYKYDLGYEYADRDILFSLDLFFRQEKGAIDWVKENSSDTRWKAKNITSSFSQGVELELKKRMNSLVNLELFYTYIDKRIRTKHYNYKYGLNYCRHRILYALNFSFRRFNSLIGFSYNQPPQRRSWVLGDTHFSYKNKKENIEFFFEVSNLLNVEYQQIPGVPSPKRTFQLGVRFYW